MEPTGSGFRCSFETSLLQNTARSLEGLVHPQVGCRAESSFMGFLKLVPLFHESSSSDL